MSELFPPEFVAALGQLRIQARRVPPGGRHAEHHAREAGSGIEFRDYRAYSPGDDLRRVDWNLYRRFDRLFVRLLDEVRDLPAYVLLDMSDSMWLDGDGDAPRRADAARRVAGAIASVSLNQLDAVGVYPFGATLKDALRPVRTKKALHRVLAFLEGLSPAGETDFRASLGAFARMPMRHGLVVVVSDFFDERGVDAIRESFTGMRHRVVFVRLTAASDRDPRLTGDRRLEDCESSRALDVTVTERVLARYREAYDRFGEGLGQVAASRGAAVAEIEVDKPILEQMGTLFQDGVLRV